MDPIRAVFGLLRIGARMAEIRERASRAAQKGVLVATLVSIALSAAAVAVCLVAYALERALVPRFGEVGSPLLLALGLVIIMAGLIICAVQILKVPPTPPPPAVKPEEMSNAALLALLSGIVVGTVLQARKETKD